MGMFDFLKGDDNRWGWGDLGAALAGPVGIYANNNWGDISGQESAGDTADAIGEAADQEMGYEFPNVEGIFGGQTVTQNPDGTVSLKQSLTPQQQTLLDSLYGQIGTAPQSVSDALYQRATSRLDPMWEQRGESAETKLFNRGLRPGDEAYDKALRELEMARTDAYQAAQSEATAAGGREQSRLLSALMAVGNPGVQGYWGDSNQLESAIAQANIKNSTPSNLDLLLQLLPGATKLAGGL